jgi:hypothetical protein
MNKLIRFIPRYKAFTDSDCKLVRMSLSALFVSATHNVTANRLDARPQSWHKNRPRVHLILRFGSTINQMPLYIFFS